MKTKFLFYSAVGFFILGCRTQDAVLYSFFATHFFTLSLCFYFYSRDNRSRSGDQTATVEDDTD